MLTIDWIADQLASNYLGDKLGQWKSYREEKIHIEETSTLIVTLVEAEQPNEYYENLDRLLSNSTLIKDFALQCKAYDAQKVRQHIEEHVLRAEFIPSTQRHQLISTIERIISMAHANLVTASTPEGRRIQVYTADWGCHFDNRLDNVENRLHDLTSALLKQNSTDNLKVHACTEVEKNSYPPVDDYISRKLLPLDVALADEWIQYLNRAKRVSLFDALQKDKLVLLLGDAGQGKSLEMNNLAHRLSGLSCYPFLIRLRDYTGQEIPELLPPGIESVPAHLRVLMFDGYDELTSDDASLFRKRIANYVNGNPGINIVISSRSNFCRAEKDNNARTFPGFFVYRLCELTHADIREYLLSHNISPDEFDRAANAGNVKSLLACAFYLCKLVSIFKKENRLPPKKHLMDTLVEESFTFDDSKYSMPLEDNKYELMLLLTKVAFAMQLMQAVKLDQGVYQQLFRNEKDRILLKHSGLFEKVGESWQFQHNNFREYLAAKYLSELEQNKVLSYVSYNGDIKPSWLNTLGYLTGFDLEWLPKWLETSTPETLVKVEPDRVDAATRYQVFERIFTKYETRHLWFSEDLCTIEELSRFSHSPKALDFLLGRIATPVHPISQYTAINILRNYPSLFGERDRVCAVLLDCCKGYPDTRNDVCRLAIYALHELGMSSPDVTTHLLDIYQNSTDDYIRLGIYEYLIASNQHNEYVQYFLQGIPLLEPFGVSVEKRIGNESYALVDGLKNMDTAESIYAVLEWYASEAYIEFYRHEEVYAKVAETAAKLSHESKHCFFDPIFKYFLLKLQKYDHDETKACLNYFVETDQVKTAVLRALSYFQDEIHHLADAFHILPQTLETFIDLYSSGEYTNDSAFREIANRYVVDESAYLRCSKLLEEHTGTGLPNYEPPINYTQRQRESQQRYFDSLFSKEKAEALLDELLAKLPHRDTKIGALKEISRAIQHNTAVWHLYFAIRQSHLEEIAVKDYFSTIDFDNNTIEKAADLIKNKEIVVSPEQKEHLVHLVQAHFRKGYIQKTPGYYEGCMNTTTYLDLAVLKLLRCLDITLSDEQLLDLTLVPHFIFNDSDPKSKFAFLSKHIAKHKLFLRVEHNLKLPKINTMLTEDHIQFCQQEQSDIATSKALELCTQAHNDTYVRYGALCYLHEMYGSTYIADKVLPYASGSYLLEVAEKCKDAPGNAVIRVLEKEYANDPNNQVLAELISHGSEIGINAYVAEVSRDNCSPSSIVHCEGPTRAVSALRDHRFLEQLERLLEATLASDYIEDRFFSLRSSVREALIGCGQTAPQETIAMVRRHCPGTDEHSSRTMLCNYIIEQIITNQKKDSDVPMTIQEVRKLLN